MDLQSIVKRNSWKVLDKRKYLLEHLELRRYAKKNEGLTLKHNGSYVILIDESTPQRNRFTIAHEIGHIYLNLTMPAQLAEVCNVSIEAATHRLKRYNEKLLERDKFYTSPLERQVHEQLKEFIKQQKEKH